MLSLTTLASAMRSGRYTQTTGEYARGQCHCAVGMAFAEAGEDPARVPTRHQFSRGMAACAWKGEPVLARPELLSEPQRARTRSLFPTAGRLLLSELNDAGFTFTELADLINAGAFTVQTWGGA